MSTQARNNCEWLIFAKKEKCNKRCVGNYCAIHNAQTKRGVKIYPCDICGYGIKHSGSCQKCRFAIHNKNMKIKCIMVEIRQKIPLYE